MSNPSSVAAPQKQMCQLLVFFVVYKHHLDKCPYKRPSPSRASSRASLLIKCPCKRPSPSRASSGASLLIKCPYKGGQARQAVQAGQARQLRPATNLIRVAVDDIFLEISCDSRVGSLCKSPTMQGTQCASTSTVMAVHGNAIMLPFGLCYVG